MSTDLEENSNLYIAENSFINFEVFNNILRTGGHIGVHENDDIIEHQLIEKDYNWHEDDEIEEDEDNLD